MHNKSHTRTLLGGIGWIQEFFKGGAQWLNFAKYFFSSFDVLGSKLMIASTK